MRWILSGKQLAILDVVNVQNALGTPRRHQHRVWGRRQCLYCLFMSSDWPEECFEMHEKHLNVLKTKIAYLTRDLCARFQKQMVPSSPAVTIWVESNVNRHTLTAFPFGWTKWWILHPVYAKQNYNDNFWRHKNWMNNDYDRSFYPEWNRQQKLLLDYSKGQYCHQWTRWPASCPGVRT